MFQTSLAPQSLSQKKLHNVIYAPLSARDPAAHAATPPFCCGRAAPWSCGGECHPHQLVIVFASLSQLAETALSPHRVVTRVSVNQDVTTDTLQTCEQIASSRAVQRGVGNSCHSLLLLHCRRLTRGAYKEQKPNGGVKKTSGAGISEPPFFLSDTLLPHTFFFLITGFETTK